MSRFKNSRVGEGNPNWKGGCTPKPCAGCGEIFTPKDHPNRTKYCSNRCSKIRNKNPRWNNGGESYVGIHNWGRYNIQKPELCQCCGEVPPRDLANISNEYKKEPSDWEWLCRRCHMIKDGRMNQLVRHPRTIFDKECEACKTRFRPESNRTRFCSRKCYDLSRKKGNINFIQD